MMCECRLLRSMDGVSPAQRRRAREVAGLQWLGGSEEAHLSGRSSQGSHQRESRMKPRSAPKEREPAGERNECGDEFRSPGEMRASSCHWCMQLSPRRCWPVSGASNPVNPGLPAGTG